MNFEIPPALRTWQTLSLRSEEPTLPAVRRWCLLVSAMIVGATVLLAGWIIQQGLQEEEELTQRVREECELRMEQRVTHVEDYFDAVYSTLLSISLDDDVMAMRRNSTPYLHRLYSHQKEQDRLAKVYVVEREFTGQHNPFLTFERELTDTPAQSDPTAVPSEAEVHVLKEQMERFETHRELRALLSDPIPLRLRDEAGGLTTGLVYSVPIWLEDRLVGIVAGVMQAEKLDRVFGPGLPHRAALLVNERGTVLADPSEAPGVQSWLEQQMKSRGAAAFFASSPPKLTVNGWIPLWTTAEILSGERWWLVYVYNQAAHQLPVGLGGWVGRMIVVGSLLMSGGALVLLVRSLSSRLLEQARHLRERKELERQVQEVSEREQRRIGEGLHEDLCQRLTGTEAAGRVLEKKLTAARLPEAALISEVVGELQACLSRARQMAEELQPVSQLEQGFLAALHELCLQVERRDGLVCRVELREFPDDLDVGVATHLYRITQEAVKNVIQHARASRLSIGLSTLNGRPTLTVKDDGIGIAERAPLGGGMGIRIMRYRAELIGADFELRSLPGGGAEMTCALPATGDGYQADRILQDLQA